MCSSALARADAHLVKLYCARDVTEVRDAEIHLNGQATHVVYVTFSDRAASTHRVDWALRDCLNTAIKLDPLHDITALARYRIAADTYEPIYPYPGQAALAYQASRKAIRLTRPPESRTR